MPTLDSAEKARRLEADDGDPDEDVIPAGKPRDGNCYHEDENCPSVKRVVGDVNEEDWTTRGQARDDGYVPCHRCVLPAADPSDLLDQLHDPEVQSVDDIDWEAV